MSIVNHLEKRLPALVAVLFFATLLTGCGGSGSGDEGSSNWDEMVWDRDNWS